MRLLLGLILAAAVSTAHAECQVSLADEAGGSFTAHYLGGAIAFNWAARGAWSCEGSGLAGTTWNQSHDFVGSETVSVDGLSGVVQPVLTCCNNSSCDSRQLTVELDGATSPPEPDPEPEPEPEPQPDPTSCGGDRAPPSHLNRATQCIWDSSRSRPANVDCTQWTSFFGSPFPQSSSTTRFFQNPGEYIALQFNTGSNWTGDLSGRFSIGEPQFGNPVFQPGSSISTISRCPGDFNRDAIVSETEAACYSSPNPFTGVSGFPRFSTKDYSGNRGNTRHFCALEPNTTYYLNVVFTNSPAGTSPNSLNWVCGSSQSRCGYLVQVQGL